MSNCDEAVEVVVAIDAVVVIVDAVVEWYLMYSLLRLGRVSCFR